MVTKEMGWLQIFKDRGEGGRALVPILGEKRGAYSKGYMTVSKGALIAEFWYILYPLTCICILTPSW